MSDETRILTGVLLLALVTVETGGLHLVKPWRSAEGMTDFQVGVARSGVPVAAILMPAGFFFSSMGKGRTSPHRLVALVFLGATLLALGLASPGVGRLVV